MQVEQLIEWITQRVPEQKAGISKQFPEFIIPSEKLVEVAAGLRGDAGLAFDYLFNLTAADRKDGFHVVYHLTSTEKKHTVVLRCILADKATAAIDSVSEIWRAAEFYEREVFDLFGIRFNNHPDLRRLFLDDNWVGYPLRKDYKDSFTIEK